MNIFIIMSMVTLFTSVGSRHAEDPYGFIFWKHGWRGRSDSGQRVLSIQTNRYLAEWDVEKVQIVHLVNLIDTPPYDKAVSICAYNSLPPSDVSLEMTIVLDGDHYVCVGSDTSRLTFPESNSRIIEAGRFFQRFDMNDLIFQTRDGRNFPGTARLEVASWPHQFYVLLYVNTRSDSSDGEVYLSLRYTNYTLRSSAVLERSDKGCYGKASIVWHAVPPTKPIADAVRLSVSSVRSKPEFLPSTYDTSLGGFYVDLPELPFDLSSSSDYTEKYKIVVENTSASNLYVPIIFAMEGKIAGITGMTPVLLENDELPSGIPVQISKNWHKNSDSPQLYEGTWFHGIAYIPMSPTSQWEGYLQMIYATWGGLPAVSHAQLCLIGWGTNQLWDQVAIGSWGETICYDPDINLNRSMINDFRPLLVHGMSSTPNSPIKWSWTHNVGGGDFLVFVDNEQQRHHLKSVRTAYYRYGPNLTEAIYSGNCYHGSIQFRASVSSPRCDDVARAYHHVRYDILKPVSFSRLAFYQMGADRYNNHQFRKLARGNRNGVIEEWSFETGGLTYDRFGIICEGEAPWWFSAHEGIPNTSKGGAWANRGLIIRELKARINGIDQPTPIASFFGTEDGIPSMNVEITPPPGVTSLSAGDYVEMLVELVAIPQHPHAYYGPNKPFHQSLETGGNTWRPLARLAIANALDITVCKGELIKIYPIRIKLNPYGEVLFRIKGGAGYVPCTVVGLRSPNVGVLTRVNPESLQNIPSLPQESDCRQVDYNAGEDWFEVTFNLCLDESAENQGSHAFRFTTNDSR